ncbi:MAG: hypothetical protein ACFCVE_15720 [Phycisphaerae bacterium]
MLCVNTINSISRFLPSGVRLLGESPRLRFSMFITVSTCPRRP